MSRPFQRNTDSGRFDAPLRLQGLVMVVQGRKENVHVHSLILPGWRRPPASLLTCRRSRVKDMWSAKFSNCPFAPLPDFFLPWMSFSAPRVFSKLRSTQGAWHLPRWMHPPLPHGGGGWGFFLGPLFHVWCSGGRWNNVSVSTRKRFLWGFGALRPHIPLLRRAPLRGHHIFSQPTCNPALLCSAPSPGSEGGLIFRNAAGNRWMSCYYRPTSLCPLLHLRRTAMNMTPTLAKCTG